MEQTRVRVITSPLLHFQTSGSVTLPYCVNCPASSLLLAAGNIDLYGVANSVSTSEGVKRQETPKDP